MKIVILSLFVVLGFSACSTKEHNPYGSYERSNAASEKAHEKLDSE